jgi:hypothetical protein
MASFEIQAPNGKKYKVEGATQEGALAALQKMLGAPQGASQGSLDMTQKSLAAIEQAQMAGPNPGTIAFSQGALQGFGDEMIGGVEALKSGFQPGVYTEARDKARQVIGAAEQEAPTGAKLAGNLTTGIPAALLTGGTTLAGATASGAGLGATSAYGETKENDAQGVWDVLYGGTIGAAGGAAGYGLGKVIEKFTAKGLAFNTIKEAVAGKVQPLIAQMKKLGASAAETDEVVREVLRQQAAKNSVAATAALDPARQRLADVNQQVVQSVDDLISPENVAAFTKRTQGETRTAVSPLYKEAYEAPKDAVSLRPSSAKEQGLYGASKPGDQVFAIQKDGKDIGFVDFRIDDGVLRINDIVANAEEGARNSLGPSSVKQLLNQVRKMFPEVKSVAGERVSGTRLGGQHVFEGGGKEVSVSLPVRTIPAELKGLPGIDEAVSAAKSMAEFKGRPFDPSDLTVEDLDVMQRFLRLKKEKSFLGDALETMKGGDYGDTRQVVNELAIKRSPALGQAQAKVALQKSVEEATDLGKQALNGNKEAIEVAEEFAALGPEAQEGYRAAFASRLRSQLAATRGAKGTKANTSSVLDKPGVVEKMKALGFPAEEIDAILERGAGARGVLDALIGGSQTARLTAAAKASESPLSKIQSGDLTAGALVHPGAVVAMPAARSAGSAQEKEVAKMIIDAFTSQDPALLQAILKRAPQSTTTPILRMLGIAGGGAAASQIGQAR